jgi:hypothetical protein
MSPFGIVCLMVFSAGMHCLAGWVLFRRIVEQISREDAETQRRKT